MVSERRTQTPRRENPMNVIQQQITELDERIEAASDEIKKLKKARRKLASALETLNPDTR